MVFIFFLSKGFSGYYDKLKDVKSEYYFLDAPPFRVYGLAYMTFPKHNITLLHQDCPFAIGNADFFSERIFGL